MATPSEDEHVTSWAAFLARDGKNGKKLLGGVVGPILEAVREGGIDMTVEEAVGLDVAGRGRCAGAAHRGVQSRAEADEQRAYVHVAEVVGSDGDEAAARTWA